ncbi:cysteine desulfurase family protein [Desulfitispora alkaliphila]|uniref:aminotransferase class V-fold PLP-dependent enzyme n=1 Tax=Desulfitispora alkaliphila TaxID=622674 RepID=UPI003D2300AA
MIYLDNAATSWPKPPQVMNAMQNYFYKVGGSPGRSGHFLSVEAGKIVFEARELLAELFNAPDPQRIVFTKNATEGLNFVLLTLLKPGDHIITTSMEHNSVMRPLRYLERKGIEVTVVQCDGEGRVSLDDLKKSIKAHTKMIVVNHASNIVGTVQPVDKIGKIAKEHKCIFVVDCAQTAGSINIDLAKMNIDIVAFTGHKGLLGPQGTGGLCLNSNIDLPPLLYGGTGSNSETETQPIHMPDKLESGTLNTIGIAGLSAGVKFILNTGISKIESYDQQITQYFIDEILKYPELELYGPREAIEKTGVISVNLKGVVCSEVGTILDRFFNIMTRTGLHCAPTAHKTIGTFSQGGTIRFGLGYFNTEKEVKKTIDALEEIIEKNIAGD